jgi:hypothetical protein
MGVELNVVTHGKSHTRTYGAWQSMKSRCLNPNHKRFNDWGGRGIKICKRWQDSFENFLEDMGEKPTKDHSLERINNDKGYSPDNCKWATKLEQSQNRRMPKHNTSGVKGVSYYNNKYNARITVNKKVIRLGVYERLEDAKEVRLKAEQKYFNH